jgi:hypothetical protein
MHRHLELGGRAPGPLTKTHIFLEVLDGDAFLTLVCDRQAWPD